MKIVVVGTGYVGLATTIFLAENGHTVVGLDIDKEKVKDLQKGKAPFYEPGLEPLLKKCITSKRLSFTADYSQALEGVEVVFICVGTPSLPTGEIDLRAVKAAFKSLVDHAPSPILAVIKSTVPPGIKEELAPILTWSRFELATCPEFLREGSAVKDIFNPDRVIIGAESKKVADLLIKLHKGTKAPIYVFNINSAQMVKYSANSFLANKISFANQIANLCDLVGADAKNVMLGLGSDKRIGLRHLMPGPGFGGSCFPKDTRALIHLAHRHGLELKMVKAANEINENQPKVIFDKVRDLVGDLVGKNVALAGLAFKAGTDDMREASVLKLIKILLREKVNIWACDPVAIPNTKKILADRINYASSIYRVVKKADCLVLMTEWPEYEKVQWGRIKKTMRRANVVDGRNLWDPKEVKKAGFKYLGVGRR